MPIAAKDFVEIEYTGKDEQGNVFDTTDKEAAKKAGIDHGHAHYGPQVICVGAGHAIKGIEAWLIGKEAGITANVKFPPEQAFGKKNSRMIQLIPTKRFQEQGINPEPGMPINVDGMYGTVKTVTGGRTVVDFNHPLANQNVAYDLKVNAIITEPAKKVDALCTMHHMHGAQVSEEAGKIIIKTPYDIPKEAQAAFSKEIEMLTGIKSVTFAK